MIRGYRGIVVALGLILTAASPPGQQGSGNNPQGPTKIEQSLDDIAAALHDANKPKPIDMGCPDLRDDTSSDLCAQWKAVDAARASAIWTERTFYLGIAGFLLGIFTFGAAFAAAMFAKKAAIETEKGANAAIEAVKETRETNAIAREAAALQLRPYVSFTSHSDEDEETPLDFSKGGYLRFKVKNFGNTPAKNVFLKYGADLFSAPVGNAKPDLDEFEVSIGTLAPGASVANKLFLEDIPNSTFNIVRSGEKSLIICMRLEYDVDAHTRDDDEISFIISKYLLDIGRGVNRLTYEERQRR